jgi:site-specific DNA recombinase
MNIIVYCRVSSREQVDGTSLDSQQAACREFAARKGWNILEVFIEQGESAKFADRTTLLELLNYCKEKERHVEALLVWKLDRFARNIEDHYMIKATLRRMGVRVVSVTEPVDTDPNGKLMEAILAGFAQFDNDIRAMRSVQGMAQKLKEGIWPWQPPLGYLPPKMGKKRVPDRPDPVRFEPLKKAWRLFATGAYSKAEIVRLLRSWGVRAYRDNLLTPQTLDFIFNNPFYSGVLRDPWTSIEYPGRHVPMVTAEEFAQVQQVIQRRNRSAPHHLVHDDFPLRGHVRCPSCSWLLTASWTKGSHARYAYYSCNQRACSRFKKSLPAKTVHDEFLAFLPDLTLPTGVTAATVEDLHDRALEQTNLSRAGAMLRHERLRDLENQVQELIAMRTSHMLSDGEFLSQRDTLRRNMMKLQAKEHEERFQPLSQPEASGLVDGFTDFPGLWVDLPPVERQAFGRLLFPMGYVYQQIRTTERGLLFRVLEGYGDASSDLVRKTKTDPNAFFAEIRKFLAIVAKSLKPKQKAA